jgi:hypothetical protein
MCTGLPTKPYKADRVAQKFGKEKNDNIIFVLSDDIRCGGIRNKPSKTSDNNPKYINVII